jgi:cell division protease FtsH
MGLATVESQYLEGRTVLNCSDVTAAAVDEEVRKIMEDCYNESKRILSENMDAMDMIAEHLIREETISGKDFMRLYRQAKGLPEPDESDKAKENTQDAAVPALPMAEESVKAETAADPAKAENAAATADEAEEKTEAAEMSAAPEAETVEAKSDETSEADEANEDDEEDDQPAVKADNRTRGRFSDVPKEDLDRLFKDK